MLTGVALAQGVAFAVAWRETREVIRAEGQGAPPAPSPAAPDKPASGTKEKAGMTVRAQAPAPAAETDPFASRLPPAEAANVLLPPASPSKDGPSSPAETMVLARPAVKAPSLDTPITDEGCLRHLDEGIYLRSRGDMRGALVELRAALALSPDHPQLLYQTARTLDMMLQEQKSLVMWQKIKTLGPEAGNCYQLALTRLRELRGVTPPAADEEPEEKAGRFSLGEVTVERLADITNGEVLRFHASVKQLQTEPVDVVKIWIKLHLFDMVNGRHIARTTAVRAEAQWPELPVDWADGTEHFDFEYRQAPLSADEILKLGQRKYYGYAVELRYGDEGQEKFEDMVAEPRELGDFARELPEQEAASPEAAVMDAPVPETGKPGQPDGTLFPGGKFDH
ncbi:MAG: tetratricopeptide-like helical domain [Verrucomicrobiales bacterium]|nr:tetratricopeptide-like helical domain [Verrucomicrobiales bacterium]